MGNGMDVGTLKRTRAAMVGVQLGLLAVFAVATVVLHVLRAHALSGAPTSVEASVYVAMALAMVISFVVLHPLAERTPTPVASRVAALLCFVASAAMALGVHAAANAHGVAGPSPLRVLRIWFLGLIVLLAALVTGAFAHEMARRDRSRTIRSLSSVVTCGLAGACAGGWTFLVDFRQPEELADLNPEVMAVVCALALLAVVGMVVASTRWADAHYHQIDMGHGYGWVSVGLLTTMFTGAVVVLLDLVMTLLWTRL